MSTQAKIDRIVADMINSACILIAEGKREQDWSKVTDGLNKLHATRDQLYHDAKHAHLMNADLTERCEG